MQTEEEILPAGFRLSRTLYVGLHQERKRVKLGNKDPTTGGWHKKRGRHDLDFWTCLTNTANI